MNQPPTNIDEYLGELKDKSPEEIVSQIRVELSEFVESTVTKESSPTILVLERKARHLFHPFLGGLMEKGYSLAFLRTLKEAIWMKGPRPKQIGLLTDCINYGDEIIRVKHHLETHDCRVNGIYSYASKQSGLESLNEEKIVRKGQIISANELGDEEFDTFFKKIQIYYQSRIEPMDIDHSNNLYRVSSVLTPSDFERVVERSCQRAMENDALHLESDDNLRLPKGMKSLSMNLQNLSTVEKGPLAKYLAPVMKKLEFEFPQIRIKVRFENSGLQFSILACCPPLNADLGFLSIPKGCTIRSLAGCYLDTISSKMKPVVLSRIVCPLCLENYVARGILDRIDEVFSLLVGASNVSVQKFDPIERP